MRLCIFDDGNGARLGVVRRNHVVDVEMMAPGLPRSKAGAQALSGVEKQRLEALAEACPLRNALRRKDQVAVLDEWEA